MNSNIRFFSEEINFVLKEKIKIRNWLIKVIREENNSPFNINYVFCSDEYLSELNKKYLHHHTYTDILTFPDHGNPKKLAGDIYISIERIEENAGIFRQTFEKECARVMVHGVLHLLGYNDKTSGDRELMARKEDYYLDKF